MTVSEALEEVNRVPGRAGAACVSDEAGRLIGIFTDGDLRRRVLRDTAFLAAPISEVMMRNPKSIRLGSLALEAALILKKHKIDELPVVDSDGKLCGILDVQDLLEVGLMPLDAEA
jgi:arabinose-5-phosphate isomerase